MRKDRALDIRQVAEELPGIDGWIAPGCHNGEGYLSDEAEVWKRVLNYRLVKRYRPERVLETHAGKGLGTAIIKSAYGGAEVVSCGDFERQIPEEGFFDFIDVDPFGFPYSALNVIKGRLKDNGILAVTSGEIISIVRGLGNSYLKSKYKGVDAWRFVPEVYIPYVEELMGLKCSFFYAYPTSVRLFLSKCALDAEVFKGCPQWMWWFEKYASVVEMREGVSVF